LSFILSDEILSILDINIIIGASALWLQFSIAFLKKYNYGSFSGLLKYISFDKIYTLSFYACIGLGSVSIIQSNIEADRGSH